MLRTSVGTYLRRYDTNVRCLSQFGCVSRQDNLCLPPSAMSQWDGHCRSIHSALRVVYLWHSNVRLRLCNILNTRDPSVREQEGILISLVIGANQDRKAINKVFTFPCWPRCPMRRMPLVEPLCALLLIDNESSSCSATTTIFPDSLSLSFIVSHPISSMPSHSPTRAAAARSSSFRVDQTFIDEPIDSIEARVVHEKDLEATDLEWLLGPDVNSPRSVGISPAYSQSGGLPALACALGTRVLIINFHSSKAYRETNPSGTQKRNIERRNRLEEELLCHPSYTHYAFDLAQVALSLRLHLHIHLANAIDLQSALPVASRDVIDSVKSIIDDASPIWEDNIASVFESTLYESNKEKDLTSLVQRAWLCGYLGGYDLSNVQAMFYAAPKVDMRKFSEEVSCLVKFIMRWSSLCPFPRNLTFYRRWHLTCCVWTT